MAQKSMADIAKDMGDIDFCMLQTHTADGLIAARPMSNNGEVEYKGTTRFFTWEHARMTADLRADPRCTITFQGSGGLFGMMGAPGMMIAVQGQGNVVKDREAFVEHWNPGLERWFKQGVDTPGLVMLEIVANRIDYWDGEDNGTLHP